MRKTIRGASAALALSVALIGCAEWDNPTALSEITPEVNFELSVARVETFGEVEVHVHVTEAGAPLRMTRTEFEIRHADGGPVRIVEVEPEGDGYAAHLMFFEPGEHHIRFMAVPERHRLLLEMGEHEIQVQRAHRVIGPYWVELELSPAPVVEGMEAHIHLLVFGLLPDGTPGAEVGGLDLHAEMHDAQGVEASLSVVEEEPGEYEAEYSFEEAGIYEVHVEIEVGGEHEDGEFHIPVLTSVDDGEGADDEPGGHGHGH